MVWGILRFNSKSSSTPNSVQLSEFNSFLLTFGKIAGIYVVVAVFLSFFTKHWIFRWRNAMNDYYMNNWVKLRPLKVQVKESKKIREDLPQQWKHLVLVFWILFTLVAFYQYYGNYRNQLKYYLSLGSRPCISLCCSNFCIVWYCFVSCNWY